MNRLAIASLAVLASASLAVAGTPAISVQVLPSSAPNFFGSPSWLNYRSNAMTGLMWGVSSVSNRSIDPAGYLTQSVWNAGDAIATGFSSWSGTASPAAPFNAELGNRMHFGLRAFRDTSAPQFSLSMLRFNMNSSDSGNVMALPDNRPSDPAWQDGFGSGDVYSASRIGVLFGTNGVYDGGTGDDVVINSGPATQLVDALFYVGIGNALAASNTGELSTRLDFFAANQPFSITTQYGFVDALGNTLGIGSGTAVVLPTPGAAALIGLAGLAATRRRR